QKTIMRGKRYILAPSRASPLYSNCKIVEFPLFRKEASDACPPGELLAWTGVTRTGGGPGAGARVRADGEGSRSRHQGPVSTGAEGSRFGPDKDVRSGMVHAGCGVRQEGR